MFNTLRYRAESEVLGRRYNNSGIGINHDIRTTIDLKTLDLQFAFDLMLIPGLIVVVVIVVVLLKSTICLAESVSNWPMPLQKPSRSRRDPAAILLAFHLLIIHRINGGYLRAYGIAAYGAATGRTKPSEAKAPVPMYRSSPYGRSP